MESLEFDAFDEQSEVLDSDKRIIGIFCGKRAGKTEIGAIKALMIHQDKPSYTKSGVDPYLGIIMAPTYDMLKRLSWKKFLAYARPFIKTDIKSPLEIIWHDGSEIYGISGDNPGRLEGVKANWIWMDEIFQMSEQLFLESLARVADQQGYIICTGSLGVNIINPKLHWAYKYFKELSDERFACFEWATIDNPYFPPEEIELLRNSLDPQTFRAMFEINWDTIPKNAVYADFDESNLISGYTYNKELETYVVIDWGWAHPMACLFLQYDRKKDMVYCFDEIVRSGLKIDELANIIQGRGYNITEWVCDIAGNQEREQTGISNVRWFRENKGVVFRYRMKAINYGIAIFRSYVKNSKGIRRFYVDDKKCPKTLDNIKQYRYAEKNGVIQNELPMKINDDPVDALRYFFVNILDPTNKPSTLRSYSYA